MSKSLRKIREKCGITEASAYRYGFNRFKEHGDSIVEYIALCRAELEGAHLFIVKKRKESNNLINASQIVILKNGKCLIRGENVLY